MRSDCRGQREDKYLQPDKDWRMFLVAVCLEGHMSHLTMKHSICCKYQWIFPRFAAASHTTGHIVVINCCIDKPSPLKHSCVDYTGVAGRSKIHHNPLLTRPTSLDMSPISPISLSPISCPRFPKQSLVASLAYLLARKLRPGSNVRTRPSSTIITIAAPIAIRIVILFSAI